MIEQLDVITLTVHLNTKTGEMGVQGPLENKILCLGMLTLAIKSVQEYKPVEAGGIVIPQVKLA